MKKKPIVIEENYLERIPCRPASLVWTSDAEGAVTLEVENTGWANRIAQKLFGRPKVSFIHLDKIGSFVWPLLDGEKTITELGKLVEEHFGEEAHPLYERLAQYFRILDSYHFIEWRTDNKQ
ncbi:MAG: PqqD family protein [Clostridia bacterium]|nr:PqqD family protein [Clostridia bacterium]